jgi:hypothetical protein
VIHQLSASSITTQILGIIEDKLTGLLQRKYLQAVYIKACTGSLLIIATLYSSVDNELRNVSHKHNIYNS